MAFVDPERFKRFEKFVSLNLAGLAGAAGRGFRSKGPGVLILYAPDDRYEGGAAPLHSDYKSRAEIDTMHEGARDELVQGMLERYNPATEMLLLAMYPDNTYDISRVVLQPPAQRPN